MGVYGPQIANSTASFSSEARAGAFLPWQNASDAWSANGVFAAMAGAYDGGDTQWLQVVDWGFAIPSGEGVTRVAIELIRRAYPSPSRPDENYVVDDALQLVKGGIIVGNSRADVSTHWAEDWETITYDFDLSEWGVSLSVSDVNAADFGVVIAVTCRARALEFCPAQIDQVRLAVYTEAGRPLWQASPLGHMLIHSNGLGV